MKTSLLASAAVVTGIFAAAAQAATVDLYGELKNAYVATGATCNDGMVFQFGADIYDLKWDEDTTLPIGLGFWANLDLHDYRPDSTVEKGHIQEIDYNIDLDLGTLFDTGAFAWSVGYLEYDYPRAGGDQENLVTFKMSYKNDFVTPSVQAKYRFGGPNEGKLETCFKLSRGFDLATIANETLSLSLAADCWYVNVDGVKGRSASESGFACADFSASLSWRALSVGVMYIARLDDEVLPSSHPDEGYGYDAKWIGSIGLAKSF